MSTPDALFCEDAERIVDELHELRRHESSLAARKADLIDRLRRVNIEHEELVVVGIDRADQRAELVERSTRAQVACALRLTDRTAGRLIDEARLLASDMPATAAALAAGEVSWAHVRAVIEEAESLPPEAVAAFERAALAGRLDIPAGRFAARCRRVREHVHPDSIERRATDAAASRCVTVQPARDGMAWLMTYLPIMQAELAHMILTGIAMDEQDAGDPRTRDQLRADALVDALLRSTRPPSVADAADAAASLPGVQVNVSITVPALTLLGHGDEPAVLEGYGPIPLETAKVLAAQATSWRRILTHPVSGVVLVHDRQTYRPPAALRAWLADRDRTCRFPGCGRKASGCDVDHCVAWKDGGCTDHDNLAHLCRRHHRLKHHTRWWARFEDDLLVWTSPTGHEYATAGRDDRAPPA